MMDGEEFDEGVVVGQKPTVMVSRHINKKSLRNKSISVTFDEKTLSDYVTGFQKRKNKRRKEAQKQLQEKERRIRTEARKKRKEARELALKGQLKEQESDLEQDVGSDPTDEPSTVTSFSGTKTYESANTTITVITSELVNGDEDMEPVHSIPKLSNKLEKKYKLPVNRKPRKGFKKRLLQKKAIKPQSRRNYGRNRKK